MKVVPMTVEQRGVIERAEVILPDWPRRLAMVPTTKPLAEDWMPKVSPATGQAGRWWDWSEESPTRLTDKTCDRELPDEPPYCNVAAMQSYRASMQQHEDFLTLARAAELTGDPKYGLALAELLARYREVYPTYPVTYYKDAGKALKFYGPEVQGKHYTERVGGYWMDTNDLQRWLKAYRIVTGALDVPAELDEAVRELTREVIEFECIPNFLYVNDKYHNSLTNYYDAFALAAAIWGQQLGVRDTISEVEYRGGDLLQLVVNGPKGIRMFEANAFDRNGVYWELSASYTGYVFGYLEGTLTLLRGLSDPLGYAPCDAVRPFYEPIERFDPAVTLPEMWRAVLAQAKLALTDGLYPPGNDSNYLGKPTPEWLDKWADLLKSDRIARVAAGVREHEGEVAEGKVEPFPPKGSTLAPASGAVTLRGPSGRMCLHLDWHRVQDYHSHLDPLNLVVAADGYLVLDDLGYHLGHPLRHIVSERTAAHSTVTVDQSDCRYHDRGVLHAYLPDGEAQLADASVPGAYPQCSTYRRTVVLVGDRYIVDLFRVEGGTTHDYALLSRSDDSECSLDLDAHEGTMAAPDTPYRGFDDLSDDVIFPSEPYEVLHAPRTGRGDRHFSVNWVQRDRPDLTTRVHHLSREGAEVILAKAPHRDRRAEMALKTDEVLIVRRSGDAPLRSTFASVIESLSGEVGPLGSTRRLPIESADPTAVCVEVVHERGADVILHALSDGPHYLPSQGITLQGTFLAVRCNGGTDVGTVLSLCGRATWSVGEQRSHEGGTGRVTRVDVRSGTVELDRPVAGGGELDGRFVVVRGETGIDEWWRVDRVSEHGRMLHLDTQHSRLVTLQGTVEGLENPRVIVCGVNFCDDIPPGTPLRIGPIGAFSTPRVRVASMQQTGLPLKLGGTTSNLTPRTSYVCLQRRAALTQADIGKPFWSSGIEEGDYVYVPTGGLE